MAIYVVLAQMFVDTLWAHFIMGLLTVAAAWVIVNWFPDENNGDESPPPGRSKIFTKRNSGILIVAVCVAIGLRSDNKGILHISQLLRSDSTELRERGAGMAIVLLLYLATGIGLLVADFMRRKRQQQRTS